MKLNRLFLIEIVILMISLVSVVAFLEIAPYLKPSKQNASIGLYREREFAEGNLAVVVGEMSNANFTYPSYDPAILIVEVTLETCEIPGNLILRCNYREFASIYVDRAGSHHSFTVVSVSGREWVMPPSSMFGFNAISFESPSTDGYEGTITYQIRIRGSR